MSTDIASNVLHSIGKRNDMNLNRLVHLALNSSPKVGIVNFNILKTFLLELLKALNLQSYELKLNDDDFDTKHLIEDALLNEVENENFINASEKKESNNSNNLIIKPPLTFERIHTLEEKLNRFEKQLSALNSLPSNQLIIDKSKDLKQGSNSGPVLEIWQYTQLSKRVESNEDGITKMTSLLQDLINELNDLKEGQNKITFDLKSLSNQFNDLLNRFTQIEQFKDALASLEKIKSLEEDIHQLKKDWFKVDKIDDHLKSLTERIDDVENKIIPMVAYSDLEPYATWPALEKALNALKDQLTRKKETTQGFTQTTPPPPAVTPRPYSSGGFHPSKELQDLLSKLGTLDSRHEDLKDEVEKLKMELSKKQNEPLRLPEDFAQKMEDIKLIKSALEQLTKDFNLETNKRKQFEKIIDDLNNELESIKDSLKELMKNAHLGSELKTLKEAISLLEDSKADKSWVRSELDKKADRRDLEAKVNKKLFEETNHEYSHLLDNCVKKNTNLEEEWKKSSDQLVKELESKLDRLELDALKDSIERQLKKLKRLQRENQNQVQTPAPTAYTAEDDAAGLRKQLLRFHCISCDRPIEVGTQTGVVPSLPADRGIRPIQTPRPYTTYELDQIRQFQKQHFYPENTSYDLFATYRQCGGSHTLTVPHKRAVKNIIPDTDEIKPSSIPPIPQFTHKNEVQIQGQDGIIYKGRIDAKLSVEMANRRPMTSKTSGFLSHSHQNLRPTTAYPGMRLSSLNHNNNNDVSVQINTSFNDDDNNNSNIHKKVIKEESNEQTFSSNSK